jgi:microcystin-dependent protein
MGSPYIAELRLMSFNFAPRGWQPCNGQLLPINQNQAIFSLLGTTYGGDGQSTFGLPNLQGRVPIGFGNGFVQGQLSGETNHTLIASEVPTHSHVLSGTTTTASSPNPTGNVFAATAGNLTLYTGASGQQPMNAATISSFGGSQSHSNQQPYLVMNWCIALQGIFPSRN